MQMPLTGGLSAELPSSINIPASFPPVEYGHDTSMDCLGDAGLFPPRPASSLPDYSDLNQAASQMQVSSIERPHGSSCPGAKPSLQQRICMLYSSCVALFIWSDSKADAVQCEIGLVLHCLWCLQDRCCLCSQRALGLIRAGPALQLRPHWWTRPARC